MTHYRTLFAAIMLATAVAAPVSAAVAPIAISMPLADWDWEWDGFRRYWRSQLGKTTGVAGVTAVVVGIGVLIICSAKKKT